MTTRILITVIDDEPSVRNAIARWVRSLGYAVTTYGNTDDFLKSPSLQETSCLILDIRMPGMSGLDLQNILPTLRPPVPIIFITGYAEEDLRVQVMKKGAVGLLEKPFELEVLADWLGSVFSGRAV